MQQGVVLEAENSLPTLGDRVRDWADAEQGRFGPWLAVCMAGGVVLYFALLAEPPAWAGAVASAAAALLAASAWRSAIGRPAALGVLAACLGFALAQVAAARAPALLTLPRTASVMSATVRAVDVLPDGRRLVLDDVRTGEGEPLGRRIRVRMKRGDATEIVAGDRVRVRAVLRPPAPPAYPGGWDLQRDAYFGGLGGGGTALAPVVVLEHRPPAGFAARVQSLRDAIGRRTMAAVPGPAGAIAATFLTGSTLAIPEADRAAFRDSGLAHLLAVAGLHIGIVMGLVFGLVRLGLAACEWTALRWPTKPIAAVTALAAGGAYMLLAGAHVPVMRSFAMACLVTLGVVVGRRALSLRGWALAAAALMVLAPQEVVGVSFQMSFAAVLALIAGYEALRPAVSRLHGPGWGRRTGAHVAALVLTSLLAGTASAPYGAYHFGHVQLYFIAANVLAVPLTAFWVMPAGLIGLALMPFGLEWLALVPMGWGIEAILWIGRTVSAWPAAVLAVPPMPGWGLLAFSAGLAWLCLWRTRVRLLGVLPIVAGLLSPLATRLPDALVSQDARLIALRMDGQYWFQAHGSVSKFTLASWDEHFAAKPMRAVGAGEPEACDKAVCRDGPILLARAPAESLDCTGTTLLISAEPARGLCPNGTALIDRFTVWRDGAAAAYVEPGGVRIVTDRGVRGERPWVPPPPTPRRTAPSLPLAPVDDLPPAAQD